MANSFISPPSSSSGSVYGHAWGQMKKNFLELLLVVVILIIISIPSNLLFDYETFYYEGVNFKIESLYGMLYWIFISTPFEYGAYFLYLKAARGEKVEVREIIHPFNRFVDVVLARILVTAIVVVGFVFLIIPGIIFAIKLAFVPYLVLDKGLDAPSAVRESWKMTSGHSWTIFAMAILAFLIFIGGMILLVVGIVPAMMWIGVAFASIYYAASANGMTPPAYVEQNES